MRLRLVTLRLPELPSDNVLALARAIKASLARQYSVRLQLADEAEDEYEDDERTPVDFPPNQTSLVIRLDEET
jgi:hypothetical protein